MKRVLRQLLFTCVLCLSAANAQIVDPQNVLIRNVLLLEGGEGTEGVSVNILIRDNKLEIITKDVVTVDDSILAVDARAGYLIGQLRIGETPSFIILNQDTTKWNRWETKYVSGVFIAAVNQRQHTIDFLEHQVNE